MSKYTVEDKVLARGKITCINIDYVHPIEVEFENGSRVWLEEKDLLPDMSNVKTIPQEEVMKSAYNKGLNDAWELAKQILYGIDKQLIEIFDKKVEPRFFDLTHKRDIINCHTPQEAKAKIEKWRESNKIEVGDVVNHREYGNGVVTREDGDFYNVVCANGDVICFEKNRITKTGKHIDISSILEQIGE